MTDLRYLCRIFVEPIKSYCYAKQNSLMHDVVIVQHLCC